MLLSAEGRALTKPGQLAFVLDERTGPVTLTVLRAGETIQLTLKFSTHSALIDDDGAERSIAIIRAYDLARLGLQMDEDGVTVDVISPVSPAFLAGLNKGDTIISVNGQPATKELLATLKVSRPILLLVRRPDGRTLHIAVDPWSNGKGTRPVGGANVLDPEVVIF